MTHYRIFGKLPSKLNQKRLNMELANGPCTKTGRKPAGATGIQGVTGDGKHEDPPL
jgi:hypothetical protein